MHSQLLPHTTAFAVATPLPAIQGGCGADRRKEENFAPGINLDLRIGRCGYEDVKEKDHTIEPPKKQPVFSAFQIHQFFNQILVYQWIISGLPVPYALFLPSLGFSPQNCDHRVTMDSESERCRRTDGRKWRCSRSVVPGQKYCERHLHRGRQGSRKHVEPSERVAKPNDKKIPDSSRTTMIPFVISGMGNIVDVLDKGGGNLAYPCRNNGSGVPVIVDPAGDKIGRDALLTIGSPTAIATASLGRGANKNDNDDRANISSASHGVDFTDGKMSVSEKVNPTKISRRKQSVTKNNHHGFVSPGFGLSPKSVLHCSAGKVGLTLDIKSVTETETETEQQRCRRTDGKKWQCRRDAVAGQKYCEAHMHRGAKRIMLSPEPASDAPTTSTQSAYVSGTVTGHPEDSINLNTVPASPDQHTVDDNSTSSTSDATTITDENISSCRNQSFRKG